MKNLTQLIFAISLIIIIACSKEGTVGPKGDTGDTGATGAPGPKGDTGTANVLYSDWMQPNWDLLDNPTSKTMHILIDENKISLNDLRDKALVLMYLKQYGTSSIYNMPSAGRWSNTEYTFTYGDNGACCKGILVRLTSTDGAALTEYQTTGLRGNAFRYIIIKGAVHLRTKKPISEMSYDEVCNLYNIPK